MLTKNRENCFTCGNSGTVMRPVYGFLAGEIINEVEEICVCRQAITPLTIRDVNRSLDKAVAAFEAYTEKHRMLRRADKNAAGIDYCGYCEAYGWVDLDINGKAICRTCQASKMPEAGRA